MEVIQLLNEITSSFPFLLPEFTIALTLAMVIIIDLIFRDKGKTFVELFTYIGILSGIVLNLFYDLPSSETTFLSSLLKTNSTVVSIKTLLDIATIACLLMYSLHSKQNDKSEPKGRSVFAEERVLWLGLLLGAHGILMANHWLSLYIGLELASISAYALTALNFTGKSAEAATKYLMIGGFSSALMLYGISWIYGFTGSMSFNVEVIQNEPLLLLGIILSMSGVFFKIALIPFQIWVPSVYESNATPIAAFFSLVPKLSGVYILSQLISSFGDFLPNNILNIVLAILGVISITWGNISALKQKNAARMMGYSSIAQVGLLVVAISFIGNDFSIILYYFRAYILMNVIAFALISWLGSTKELSEFSSLGKRFPSIGIAAAISMLALTGLPPTAGFTGKFLIFSELWSVYQLEDNYYIFIVFVVGIFNTAVSLFFYLKLPYYMFFRTTNTIETMRVTAIQKVSLLLLSLGLIWLFLSPM